MHVSDSSLPLGSSLHRLATLTDKRPALLAVVHETGFEPANLSELRVKQCALATCILMRDPRESRTPDTRETVWYFPTKL